LSKALGICLVGNAWIGCRQHHKAQEGALGGLVGANAFGETLAGTLQPCSDVLAHTLEVCKGAHLYNEYLATRDDHNSWGMCTTSIECQLL
jgi:hypothetical protein